jgi:hypothetical protein
VEALSLMTDLEVLVGLPTRASKAPSRYRSALYSGMPDRDESHETRP